MIKVWVEEEYGYADYIWDAPFETGEEITAITTLARKNLFLS